MLMTRFNPEKRKSLLRAFRSGTNQRRLAARYGVDQSTISRQIDLAIEEKLEKEGARLLAIKERLARGGAGADGH
jgi:transposase-like protein